MFQEIPTKQHYLALGIKVSIILINAFSNHYLDAPLSLKVYAFSVGCMAVVQKDQI